MDIFAQKYRRSTVISLLIILIGFVFLMMPVIPYGWHHECVAGKCGIYFADIYRARDDLWHMSLAQVAFDTFPFRMPIYAGGFLQSYHFLYSAILGTVTRLGISVNFGYYVVLPIIWFATYTACTIQLAKKLTNDHRAIPIFLFFSYFASGLSYLLSLKNTGSLWNDIGWFSNQPAEYMINPTLALSLVLFQLLILTLIRGVQGTKRTFILFLVMFLLWGSKFYGGVIGGTFVGIYFMSEAAERKVRLRQLIILLAGIGFVSLCAIMVFYNPLSTMGKGGVFTLEPFKTIHPMIEDPELLPIMRLARLRYLLYTKSLIFWPILMLIEQTTLTLYLVFAYGTRLLGLGLFFIREKVSPVYSALFGSVIIATLFPVFFTQKGGDWFNTTQFMAYAQFFLQIALAVYVYKLRMLRTRKVQFFVGIVLCITFLGALNPIAEYGRNLPVISRFISSKLFQPRVYVSDLELDALSFLSKKEDGIVFTLPFTPIQDTTPVRQLWKTNDTALVAALGNKQMYIGNVQQLDLMGIEHTKRTKELKNLNTVNISKLPVRYFYLYKGHPSYISFVKRLKPYATMLFENGEVEVWEKK
jgi:hypothetical protein